MMWFYHSTLSLLTGSPLLGLLLLFIILLTTYSYLSRSPWKRLPPGPPSFPVIGSLPFLIGDGRKVFSKLAAKYGDVFTLYVGSTRMIVLNKYDVIKEALLKTPRIFDVRTDMFKDIDNGTGIISSAGHVWKEQRRFILHTLRNFGLGQRSLADLVQDESQHLLTDLISIGGSTAVNPQALIQKSVANVIAVVLFGERFEFDDPQFIQHLSEMRELTEIVGPNNPAMLFRVLRYIPGDPFKYGRIKSVADAWYKGWKVLIEERRNKLHNDKDFIPTDLISLYLQQVPDWKEHGDSTYFDEHLVHVISDMFGAGTDTTSNTLVWAILYLILDPDIQNKIHAEIDDVIGRERSPDMQDRRNMPYTDAVLSEVQRISDVVPFALPHGTLEDTTLLGYTIPRGSVIIPNLTSVHQDPTLWPNPEQFDPGRFLDEQGKYRKRDELLPFGIGKRSCLGENLAKMELFLFFVKLLQRIRFSIPPNQPRPSTEGVLGITHHAKPFDVQINVR